MPSEVEPFDPVPLIEVLARSEVDFVVIGGVAGGMHGSAYGTYDLDIAYARDRANLERLVAVLEEPGATLRGAPEEDVPFLLDAKTLWNGSHFTFSTSYGSLDILSDPVGAPSYAELKRAGTRATVRGREVVFASLDHLIAMKEATGRPRTGWWQWSTADSRTRSAHRRSQAKPPERTPLRASAAAPRACAAPPRRRGSRRKRP